MSGPPSWLARAAGALVSPWALVVVVAPLAAAALAGAAGVLAWEGLLSARTVVLFVGAAAVLTAVRGGWAAAGEQRAVAVALGIAGCLLGEAAVALALRVDATLDAGQGEEGAAWRVARRGPWARLPSVTVVELPASRKGTARLRVDGRDVAVQIAGAVRARAGAELTVADVFTAPAFVLRRAGGAEEGAGLLKLVPAQRDWFEVGVLPHRFYVTLPPPTGDEVSLAGRVHVRVQRGKVRVLERDLALGEEAAFEGLVLVFQPGAPWARLGLSGWPRGPGALAAAALALGAFAVARRRRP